MARLQFMPVVMGNYPRFVLTLTDLRWILRRTPYGAAKAGVGMRMYTPTHCQDRKLGFLR